MHLNSAAIGSVYLDPQTAPVSPDTPAKAPPDETSYSAPSGGVLAAVNLEVMGDQSGDTLFMQLDDANPNGPGSGVSIFTESGTTDAIYLPESDLGSGFHAEGAETCATVPTPTNEVPTPTVRVADHRAERSL